MTTPPAALRALDRARRRYESDGYIVRTEERLPSPFHAFVADAVAQRNAEFVVIEVRSADMTDQSRNRLARLAEVIAARVGWRIDVVTYEPEVSLGETYKDDIVRRAEEARRLADLSPDGAFLLAWSAFEGAIRRLGQEGGLGAGCVLASRTLIHDLAINGLLSDNQASELDALARLHNEIAHGMRSRPLEPDRLDWLTRFALATADRAPVTLDDMIDWFRSHYATPEEAALLYDKEGGDYLWFGADPHDAEDVLREQFETSLDAALALEADVVEAVSIIERDGSDWARQADL